MAIYAGLVVQEDAAVFNFILGYAHKEWWLGNHDFLNRGKGHEAIKLLDNEMRVDPEREHAKDPIADNHHHILNNMDFLNGSGILKVAHKAELLLHRPVDQFSHDSFQAMREEDH